MAIFRVDHDFDLASTSLGLDLELDVNVQYITAKTDSREQVISDSSFVGHYGQNITAIAGRDLYVHKATIEWGGEDANVAWWDSVVTVSSKQPERALQPENPLMRPVRRLKWESTREMFPSLVDHNGQFAANTAGDYFGAFEIELQLKKLFFSMNYLSPPDWAFFLDGAVNSQEITILGVVMPPGTAKLYVPEGPLEPTVENGYSYYQINYEIHFNPMGWQSLQWNVGFQELKYTDYAGNIVNPLATPGNAAGQLKKISKVAILDDRGEPVKNEQYLDIYGRRIASKHIRPKSLAVGTAVTTQGSRTIVPSGGLSVADEDLGLVIAFRHLTPDIFPHMFVTQIVARNTVFAATDFTIQDPMPWSTTATVFLPGISAISLAKAPYANFVAAGIPF